MRSTTLVPRIVSFAAVPRRSKPLSRSSSLPIEEPSANSKLSTPRLTRALQDAVARQQPPRDGLGRPKLRYAHQGGRNPPIVVVHGSALHAIPDSYKRFLEHFFRDTFKWQGTPLVVQFKSGRNPFEGRPKRA